MKIAMIGLGRMGGNMARRLLRGGHEVVAFDRDLQNVAALEAEGAYGATSLADAIVSLSPPRVVWVMVPAGRPTEEVFERLGSMLSAGDIAVDGGNSHFKDDIRRAAAFAARGVSYLDAGTSGGIWGLERGYCLMVGGDQDAFATIEPVLRTLAPGNAGVAAASQRTGRESTAEQGYLRCGPAGAGHFVKMIHNGIEYGLMQAYAEGFDILAGAAATPADAEYRYEFDLADIAELWRRGSVVSSWLLDLTSAALAANPTLDRYSGHVSDSGEGRWTVQAAVEQAVPAEVLTSALYARFRSRQQHTFAERIVSAMRHGFGGHVEPARRVGDAGETATRAAERSAADSDSDG